LKSTWSQRRSQASAACSPCRKARLAPESPVSGQRYWTSRAKCREFGGESPLDEFSISEIQERRAVRPVAFWQRPVRTAAQRQCRGPGLRRLRRDSVCRLGRLRRAMYEGPRLRELKNGWSPGTLKNKAPLGAGQVLSVLPDMPFNPGPYIPCGRCPLLERWPRWGASAIYFRWRPSANGATKMAQRKKPARSSGLAFRPSMSSRGRPT
jgi:hypothetical protein